MGNVPFGYKNLRFFNEYGTISHDVIVVEEEAKMVNIAFEMRSKGKQLKDIVKYFSDNGYKKSSSTVNHMLKNIFYIGIQKGKLGEAEIKSPGYRSIIPCQLFEKVNNIRRKYVGFHTVPYEAPLKGLVYGPDKEPLIAYETTNRYGTSYTYYRTKLHSVKKFNFSQNKLVDSFDKYMSEFNFSDECLKDMSKSLKKAFFSDNKPINEKRIIQDELIDIDNSKRILSKKLIKGVVSDEDYKELSLSYLKNKKLLEEKLLGLSIETKDNSILIRKWVELLSKLLPVYNTKGLGQKAGILKSLQVELFIKDDLSLAIRENPLIKCAKLCGLYYGSKY